jgi:WD40 repeat protein
MNPWLNLLLQIAVPVLKTLVYAGTSNLLTCLQEELNKEQQQQKKLVLDRLGINSANFQEQITTFTYDRAIEVQDLSTDVNRAIDEADLDFQQQRFQREKAWQQQLNAQKRENLWQLAAYQRETALLLPEVQKTLEYWPLRLFPSQLLETSPSDRPLPVKVLLAPPQILCDRFDDAIAAKTADIESSLAQGLREFFARHYSLHSQIRPVEFLGGVWQNHNFKGESTIKALFGVLKFQPTLVLESEINGNNLNFRIAYWSLGQDQYCYQTIFTFSYQEFLEDSVKTRALQWKKTKDKLLALGKDGETIARLGGDNEINLLILEEIEELQQAGIDIEDLNFQYQFGDRDFENLNRFLTLCHSLMAGWIADIHYLIHYDVSPILPEFLTNLAEEISTQKFLPEAIRTTISIYQEVLQALAKERPYWLPELVLKLAQSLLNLPDRNLAREQLEFSLKLWLQQRQLSSLSSFTDLETIKLVLTTQEREYLTTLQDSFTLIEEESNLTLVQNLLRIATESQEKPLNRKVNFSLVRTITEISESAISLTIDRESNLLISSKCGVTKLDRLTNWQEITKPETLFCTHPIAAEEISTLAISPDGTTLAISEMPEAALRLGRTQQRSYLQIFDLKTGKLQKILFGHKKQIDVLAFSPDGQFIASGSHKIKLWNLQTGEAFQTIFGHKQWICSLAISNDGETLVSGSEDKTVRIWNLRTGELLHTLTGHQGSVNTVAISPDRQTILSGSEDSTTALWDLNSGKLLHTFTSHTKAISAIVFTPDGQHFISASEDKTIKIWHLHQRELVQTLDNLPETVSSLAMSSDGQMLTSSSKDKTIQIWLVERSKIL